MPEATFRHSATTTASAEEVWEALQDPATWASVAGVDETSEHEREGDALAGFHFTTYIAGMAYRGSARVAEAVPGQRMTLTIRSNELTGTIHVELSRASAATGLDVTMAMRPAGIMGAVVFPVVSAAVSNGFEGSVDALALALGEGEG